MSSVNQRPVAQGHLSASTRVNIPTTFVYNQSVLQDMSQLQENVTIDSTADGHFVRTPMPEEANTLSSPHETTASRQLEMADDCNIQRRLVDTEKVMQEDGQLTAAKSFDQLEGELLVSSLDEAPDDFDYEQEYVDLHQHLDSLYKHCGIEH